MNTQIWLPLQAELDHWHTLGRTLRIWLRDDDAIAPSAALDRLARLGERHSLPVLLAVIPMLAEPALVPYLRTVPILLPCQHGAWHRNQAPAGAKKSEFGRDRPAATACADIAAGRRRLRDLLGPEVLPVFVPPWNRITPDIAAALPGLGFSGLSCFRRFELGPRGGPALANSDVDVMDWHGGRVGRPAAALVAEICTHLVAARNAPGQAGDVLGLLLHHRDHDETAWGALDALLDRLCSHPAVSSADPRAIMGLTA